MSRSVLRFRAGAEVLEHLRREGFALSRFDLVAGASGGPKWLVLSQVDRVILSHLYHDRERPVSLVGSSIGSWRFTCYGMPEPVAALGRLEDAYVEQSYSAKPSPQEVSRVSRDIFRAITGQNGAREVLRHPLARLNVIAVRSRGAAASQRRWIQGAAVLAAAAANALTPRALGLWYERVLLSDPREERPLTAEVRAPLTAGNLEDAVMASGSIPLVMEGVRDIEGAPPGVYRDGGVTDYHVHSPLTGADGVVLYPHYSGHLVPGWFDKGLPWRRAGRGVTSRMLLMYPDPGFVARLPYGKIPDRRDFHVLDPEARKRYWRRVIAECERLAEELARVLETGELGERVEPAP